MMGAIITVVLNLVLNQALVFGIPSIGFQGFGFHGSPLATSIALVTTITRLAAQLHTIHRATSTQLPDTVTPTSALTP